MKRSLLLVFLIALILALMVPLSLNMTQSELAFTRDNLIFLDGARHLTN
jgi:hypothetical protein